MSQEVADYLRRGRWAAVSTFGGHPLAVAAVAANIRIMLDEKVVEHVAEVGTAFGEELAALVERHPSALGLSGRGLAWSIELCKNPDTGEKWVPADRWLTPSVDGEPEFMPGRLIASECEKHGVLLFNFVPNTVTIAPPLKITRDELDHGVAALEKAFTELDRHIVSAPGLPGTID
jgi:taurine--2-oxoglutarate transaminase